MKMRNFSRPASMKNDRGGRRVRFREGGARRELAGASDRSETASNDALGIENKPDAVRIYARRSSATVATALSLLALCVGCAVPLSSTAPLVGPAASSNATHGIGLALETAPVDILQTTAAPPSASSPSSYPKVSDAPKANGAFQGQWTIRLQRRTWLLLGAEGTLYGPIPVPHFGSLGVRQILMEKKSAVVGVQVGGGYGGFLADSNGDNEAVADSRLHLLSARAGVDLTLRPTKTLQPSVAFTARPILALPSVPGQDAEPLKGGSASLSLRLSYKLWTVFAAGTSVYSSNVRGWDQYLSGGVALRL